MKSATFQESFAAARDSYTPERWEGMSSAERVRAIYHEMRRIDSERARTKSPSRRPRKGADDAASTSDPTFICFCRTRTQQIIACLGIDAEEPKAAWNEACGLWRDLDAMDAIEVWLNDRMVYQAPVQQELDTR